MAQPSRCKPAELGIIKGVLSFPSKGNLARAMAQVRASTLRSSAATEDGWRKYQVAPETRRNPLQWYSEHSRTIRCADKRFTRDPAGPLRTFSANCIVPIAVPYFSYTSTSSGKGRTAGCALKAPPSCPGLILIRAGCVPAATKPYWEPCRRTCKQSSGSLPDPCVRSSP